MLGNGLLSLDSSLMIAVTCGVKSCLFVHYDGMELGSGQIPPNDHYQSQKIVEV